MRRKKLLLAKVTSEVEFYIFLLACTLIPTYCGWGMNHSAEGICGRSAVWKEVAQTSLSERRMEQGEKVTCSARWMGLLNERPKALIRKGILRARWRWDDERGLRLQMSDQLIPLIKLQNQQSDLFRNAWCFWSELLMGQVPVSSSASQIAVLVVSPGFWCMCHWWKRRSSVSHLSCHVKFKRLERGQNADKWDDFDINLSCVYELF